jgi:hypothetical protein
LSLSNQHELGHLRSSFFRKGGPRGTRQKKLQNLDSIDECLVESHFGLMAVGLEPKSTNLYPPVCMDVFYQYSTIILSIVICCLIIVVSRTCSTNRYAFLAACSGITSPSSSTTSCVTLCTTATAHCAESDI